MVRLRSGRFDWTVQVVYPPPVTESRVRRRAQEKAIRTTLGSPQKNIAEAKQGSTPILVLDFNSGLGLLKREQVEEPFVGEHHRGTRSWRDTNWKDCSETQTVLSITLYSEAGQTSPQGTSLTLDHWVELVGIHHIVEDCRVPWKTGRRLQIIQQGFRETACQFC